MRSSSDTTEKKKKKTEGRRSLPHVRIHYHARWGEEAEEDETLLEKG